MAVPLPHHSFYAFYPELPSELQLNQTDFTRIWNLHPTEFGKVNVFGVKNTPRWQQPYGKNYNFSKTDHPALPIEDPFFLKLMKYCEDHTATYMNRVPFNGLLVNWYQDGNHYIGAHSDSESDLVAGSPIYSFSYGQERDFIIRPKVVDDEWIAFRNHNKLKEDRIVLALPGNSLVIMGGQMQTYYKHEVPKRALSTAPNPRINITIRHFR